MNIQQSSYITNNFNMSKDVSNVPIKRIKSSYTRNKNLKMSGIFSQNIIPESNICSRIMIKEKVIPCEHENNEIKNLCFEDCPNYEIIKKYEQDLFDVIESNINLKKINEYLLKTITIKDELFLDITNKNKDLKLDNNLLNSHIGSKRILSARQCQIRKNFNDLDNSELFEIPSNADHNRIFNYNINTTSCKVSSFTNGNVNQKQNYLNSNGRNKLVNNQNKKKNDKFQENCKDQIINASQKNQNLNTFLTIGSSKKWNNISKKQVYSNIGEVTNKQKHSENNPKLKSYGSNSFVTFFKKPISNSDIYLNHNTNPNNYIESEIKQVSTRCNRIGSSRQTSALKKKISVYSNESKDENHKANLENIYHTSSENLSSSSNNNSSNVGKNKVNFYEHISNIASKNEKNMKFKNKARSSLLGLQDQALSRIITNEVISNLKKLTLNDEEFIEFFRTKSEERLINYSDGIYQIIRDLESAIKLIQRMRSYIMIISNLANCALIEEISAIIIKEACKIMECDRTSIFMYDNLSDMLIVHTAEGLKRNEIRVPKNVGIVGSAFLKAEIIRVDDAYADSRFSKEFDKKSNYHTKTVLAAPLKDSNGIPIGVIQSINKNNNQKFTDDDEELIFLFSMHISHIMKNAKSNDENVTYVARLKMIIQFKEDLLKTNNLIDISHCIENIITNIFSTQYSQILIYNPKKNNLVKISKYERIEKNKNLGIVGYVFEKKEYFGVNSSNGCQFFNNLVDLETGMTLLTYPIITNGEIKAILQFSYNEKLTHFKKLKESDDQIIKYIIIDCEKWFLKNEEIVISGLN